MTKYPDTQTDNTAKDEVNEALDTPEDGQPGVHIGDGPQLVPHPNPLVKSRRWSNYF
jgi:hypothetical protein